MNFELHIIGSREGFEKYPHDGFDEEAKRCVALLQGAETLVISRAQEVIHYVYLHDIGQKGARDYVGLSISFNGVYFRSVEKAFEVMERLFETAVYEGLMIHVSDNGQVEFNPQSFYDQRAQYNQLKKGTQRVLDSLPRNSITSLPRSFRIGQGDNRVTLEEGESVVADRVAQFDRVAVSRESGHSGLSDIQERLERLHKQNVEWEQKYNEERKKKKQYSLVVVLLLILLLGGAGAAYIIRGNFFTIGSLEEDVSQLNEELSLRKEDIRRHQMHIAKLQDTVVHQIKKIESLSDSLQQKEYALSRFASLEYTVGMPTVDNNSFDEGYSMWLYAEVPITIESLALRAKSSGYADIVLRDCEGNYVASETVYVNTYFSQKTVDLKIPSSGYYSLNVETSGMRLQYNSVSSDTYRTMGSGPLRIKGCCVRGKGYGSAQQNYYQYFYNIKYRLAL
jgi:hypothetical protein